jgi:hypothetical protein
VADFLCYEVLCYAVLAMLGEWVVIREEGN